MTADCSRIQDLIVKMQATFLDVPGLSLTLPQAQRQFATDAVTCETLLGVLVEAGVLTRTPRGQYRRLYPRSINRAAA
jgi:hypothetical protein